MEFLKKNYEKVVLGVVLAGAAVAVAFLPFMVASEKQRLQEASSRIINRPAKPLEPLDLAHPEAMLKRLSVPALLDLSTSNKVFNPVLWQKTVDGRPVKAEGGSIGAAAVVVTRTAPLHLTITLDSVVVSDSGARYVIGVEREAAARVDQRRKRQFYTSPNEKKEGFVLREVKGPVDNPTEVILELTDTNETISVSKEKPFRRVDGHIADLRYDPEKKTFLNRRVGDRLAFAGEEYNIVAITQNEVILSAKSNNKKTTIRYAAQ